jgi:Tol biopolymer transport system component
LLPTFYAAHDPWWSADSQTIYFTGAKDDRTPFPEYLWRVGVSDGRLTQLTTRECGRAHPSPDGRVIYCGYYHYVPHLYRVSPTGQEGPELPGIQEGFNLLVGSRYLYLLSKGTLFRYDPENGSAQRIGDAPHDSRLDRFSPDERFLTVKVRSTEKSRIILVDGLR